MEQINKIELRGYVGNVRLNKVGEKAVANFSISTNYAYKSPSGDPVIETCWVNAIVWENKNLPSVETIRKGCVIHLVGRLKYRKYTGNDGIEKDIYEVLGYDFRVEEENPTIQMGKAE